MLAHIRAFAKSPVAMVILGLLLISFVVFGIGDVFRSGSIRDSVVQAGSRSINSATFKRYFDNYKQDIEKNQNGGQPITAEQAAQAGIDKALAEQLAVTESVAELFKRIGLSPSDKLVASELRKTPAFFDPVTGKFDRQAYVAALQNAGLTDQQYEGVLRDQIAQTHFVSGLAAGFTAPRTYLAALSTYARESRDFSWFMLGGDSAGAPAKPTDAELTAYIKTNAPLFTKPELRSFTLLRFSPTMVAPSVKIDEAAVQKRFDFEKDTLSTPETRSFVQVPVKDAGQAAQAVAKLKAGQDATAVAKSLGVQPVSYVNAPKTGVSDRQIGEAAFKMKEGEVAGPVQGSLGLQVIQVTKVNPGHQATLEEARPKIEAEVRKDAATEKVYEQVQKYEDLRSGGATLAEAAMKMGMMPVPTPFPLTAQGADISGRTLNIPPKLMQSVFSLPERGESDVLDLGQGEYAAIRVDKIFPTGLASLDEVRTAATQRYVLEDLTKRVKAKADAIEAQVKKGTPIAAAAASVGAKLTTATGVRREQAGKEYSADLLNKVFLAKAGDVVVGDGTQLGFIIAKLDKVNAAAPAEIAPLIEQQRAGFRNALFDDLSSAARQGARNEIKPKVDYARARTAIGLEAQAPAAPATKK